MSKRQMGKGNNNWIENYPYRNYVNMKKLLLVNHLNVTFVENTD